MMINQDNLIHLSMFILYLKPKYIRYHPKLFGLGFLSGFRYFYLTFGLFRNQFNDKAVKKSKILYKIEFRF